MNVTFKAELKKTISLAVPIVLGQLGQVLFGVMDNVMVGRLGAVPLAAAGFANNVTAIPMLFLVGVASSISVMVARSEGAGHQNECGKYVLSGLSLLITIMIALLTFAELGPDILSWFKQPPEVLTEARGFFRLIAWSMLPMVVFHGLRQFTVGLEKAFLPTLILAGGLLMNFILNYILIYGNWGAPALGIVGAGWSTLASRTFIAIVLCGFVFKAKMFEKYRAGFQFKRLESKYFRPIAKLGLASGLQYLFEVGAFTACGFMAGWVGTEALAAHQISLNVGSITFMFAWGISFASSVRVGQAVGHGHMQNARQRGLAALVLILSVMSFFGICIVILRSFIPNFYVENANVVEIATHLLLICSVFQIFDGLQGVVVGALRGLGDILFPSVATLFIYWGVCIPISYYMSFKLNFGVQGLWWGLTTGLALAAVVLVSRFHYLTRTS